MENVCAVISCLLLTVGAATAQTVKPQERPLPQWLTGIIAVVGFLFLSFVVFLMKKAWCDEPSRNKGSVRVNSTVMTEENPYETSLDPIRSKGDMNVYENQTFENSDEKVTSM